MTPPVRVYCRVVEIAEATHDIRIVRLAPEGGERFLFLAGQYASVSFADLPARDYSMANRPDEAMLEFHIRRVREDGASGFATRGLKPGDRVTIEGPFGNAWLRQDAGPILAVAGGSGLAPLKSIVETALHLGMRQDIRLYLAARDERDIYLEDHFARLVRRHPNLRFVPVLQHPAAGRRSGTPAEAVAEDIPNLHGFQAYLAGPPPLVEAMARSLGERGLRDADIHADPFYTVAEKAAARAAGRTLLG